MKTSLYIIYLYIYFYIYLIVSIVSLANTVQFIRERQKVCVCCSPSETIETIETIDFIQWSWSRKAMILLVFH